MGNGGSSMITLHTAIRNLYPNVTSVLEDSAGNFTCKDKDGNVVKIDEADVNTEYAKIEYKNKRTGVGVGTTVGYPSITEQLDLLYHDIEAGKLGVAATTGQWYVGITSIKTLYPKPS